MTTTTIECRGTRTIAGRLARIAAVAAAAGIRPPALMIVGTVVTLAPTLGWFSAR